ncbi:MAG: AzlD domain-containing protein [Clostridia bacterium]|nr:AzlD domain-containing protein [Clostridia bacterium]
MTHSIYVYIMVMAGVSYLIRVLPLTLIRKQIKSRFIRSFLYYVPYVTLSVMTFPAILHETGSLWSAWLGFAAALAVAWKGKSLLVVASAACAVVFLSELVLTR